MCTLHLFYKTFASAPLLFAANRDENLDRPWTEPSRLPGERGVFGPRDGSAGGTWLGVNERGLLVSLANHWGTLGNGQSLCSRGLLVAASLRGADAREALAFALEMVPRCKAFTLLLADPEQAYVVDSSPGRLVTHTLEPGLHVITNALYGDPEDLKAARSLRRMAALGNGGPPSGEDLVAFLADHESGGPGVSPLCIHPPDEDRFGTSSASVVQVGSDREVQRFLFCSGPPCAGSWSDLTEACRASLSARIVTTEASPELRD